MATILIIDDEVRLRANLCDVLGFEGFTVIEADNGIEGLQKAQDDQPDLALCDIAMPGLDGYQFLQRLRNDPQTADMPVVLLTARADRASAERAKSLGANGYIKKPFTFDEVLTVIQNLLGET